MPRFMAVFRGLLRDNDGENKPLIWPVCASNSHDDTGGLLK